MTRQGIPRGAGLISRRCRGCAHLYHGSGGEAAGYLLCLYILHERRPRPCPAGDGCTAYAPGKRQHKNGED